VETRRRKKEHGRTFAVVPCRNGASMCTNTVHGYTLLTYYQYRYLYHNIRSTRDAQSSLLVLCNQPTMKSVERGKGVVLLYPTGKSYKMYGGKEEEDTRKTMFLHE
jgi:hypothetical protein